MATLKDFISIEDTSVLQQPSNGHIDLFFPPLPYHNGQPVWWIPPAGSRPAFMLKTQSMIAATVKSINPLQRTVFIEHQDPTKKVHTFVVPSVELARRELPR